jgi:hypothetical protein
MSRDRSRGAGAVYSPQMKTRDIVRIRLSNQRLTAAGEEGPADVVAHLGAVQAQDYLGGLWAVGLRVPGSTEADVERAIAERKIVRTWPMRGTLHFVAAKDVRWMLELLTPRVLARSAGRLRQLELDDATLSTCEKVLVRALGGGKQLTRAATYRVLEDAKISTGGSRGLHILGWLAQRGVICFGAREGKQQTLALLDEWAPGAIRLERDEALAELARRYVASHGPATLRDFAWWSGLTVADARAAVEGAGAAVEEARVDGETYLVSPSAEAAPAAPGVHLLPVYDEYAVAYRDRDIILDPEHAAKAKNGIFSPVVVAKGRIVGTWGRRLTAKGVSVTPSLFSRLGGGERTELAAAVERYAAFLDVSEAKVPGSERTNG